MSLGGKSNTAQTTSSTAPWGPQQGYILDVFKNAQSQFQGGGPQWYTGDTLAGFTPEQKAAQQQASSWATGAGSDFASQMLQAAAYNLGEGMNVGANPWLQAAIQSATRPIFQGLTDAGGPLQAARNQAVATGQYGGSRQGVAEGLATSRATEQAGNIGAQMTNQAWQQALQQQLSTLLGGGSIMSAATQPAQVLSAVGAEKQNYAQQLIDNMMQKWNYEQNLPMMMLQNYSNLVGGNYGGTSYGTVPTGRSGGATGALGGAMSGAALGSLVPGIGTAVGAGIGGLIGLMG
jgi:hypothetical protein